MSGAVLCSSKRDAGPLATVMACSVLGLELHLERQLLWAETGTVLYCLPASHQKAAARTRLHIQLQQTPNSLPKPAVRPTVATAFNPRPPVAKAAAPTAEAAVLKGPPTLASLRARAGIARGQPAAAAAPGAAPAISPVSSQSPSPPKARPQAAARTTPLTAQARLVACSASGAAVAHPVSIDLLCHVAVNAPVSVWAADPCMAGMSPHLAMANIARASASHF